MVAIKFDAPDSIGFVELLDAFGDDLTVVNAARVSFSKESSIFTERDEGLIKYLASHNHCSPFFHPMLRFRTKMPLFVAREWYRHTIGFARNEVSRRYVDSPVEVWLPGPSEMRERHPSKKQGSVENVVTNATSLSEECSELVTCCSNMYNKMIQEGVAPEVARTILPLGTYTEFIETASLAAYARLWALRVSPDAQKEIQWYAECIGTAIATKFPKCWEYLTTTATHH